MKSGKNNHFDPGDEIEVEPGDAFSAIPESCPLNSQPSFDPTPIFVGVGVVVVVVVVVIACPECLVVAPAFAL